MAKPSNTETTKGKSEGPLGRWSRRKQSAANLQNAVPETVDEAAQFSSENVDNIGLTNTLATTQSTSQANNSDWQDTDNKELVSDVEEPLEPLLTDDDMPPLETLNSDSNVSCFFNRGVSETLRQAALKKLLHLPAFNIVDGLNDYDEDYTYFEPLGDIVTCDMKYHTERLAKLEEDKLEQERADAEEALLAESESEGEEQDELETAEADVDLENADEPDSEQITEEEPMAEIDETAEDTELEPAIGRESDTTNGERA